MSRLLPALHEGHAPIYLHHAFCDALYAYEEWRPGIAEPQVDYENNAVPISSIFGRMRNCTDLLPARVRELVMTIAPAHLLPDGDADVRYAEAAIVMRALCVERLRRRPA